MGDTSEQKGKVKVKWYDIKLKWMQWKDELILHIAFSATDIIPLINQIFILSYDNLVANLKATADRGWFPFNRMLLDHPDLVNNSKSVDANTQADNSEVAATSVGNIGNDVAETSNSNTENTITLNIGKGASAAVLNWLIAKRAKYAGRKKAEDKRKKNGDSSTQNLREAKKLSAGVIVSNGIQFLNNKRFLKAYNQRRLDAIEKVQEKCHQK